MAEQKKILISLPDNLLDEVDSFTQQEGFTRSEFVRQALKHFMKERRRVEIRERMKKGYQEMGKINLNIAEDCLESDSRQLKSYEEILG